MNILVLGKKDFDKSIQTTLQYQIRINLTLILMMLKRLLKK